MAKDTLKIEQGARLYQIMVSLGLTQIAVGQLVGLSQSYISQIIAGDRSISKKILQFIANSHPEINIEWLLTGTGNMQKPGNTQFVNEQQHGYGRGMLESLMQKVHQMDERLKALEQSKKEE